MAHGRSGAEPPMVGNEDGNASWSGALASDCGHLSSVIIVNTTCASHAWGRKVARGAVLVVRYADVTVVGFRYREDAERFQKKLHERLTKFWLELNAEKRPLIEVGQWAKQDRKRRGAGKPETFNVLGFAHSCTLTQQSGNQP